MAFAPPAATRAGSTVRTCTVVMLLMCVGWCSTVAHAAALQHRPSIRPAGMPRVLRINADFECAKACFEHQCDMHSLRYGKFCGVGHGGCPGEEPCDAVDACCQVHDDCVEAEGLLAESCHKDFLACLRRVREEEPADSGFSTTCPYAMVIPNMEDGIELSLKLAGLVKNLMGSAAQQAS